MPATWQEYQSQLNALLREVDSKETIRILESKLFNYFSKHKYSSPQTIKDYIELITPPEMAVVADQIYNNYNNIVNIVNDLYSDIGKNVTRDFSKIRNIEEVTKGYLGKFEAATEKKLITTIRKGLADELSAKEFSKEIAKTGDAVSAYADTIAITKLKDYGSLAKIEKARIAEVLYFDYVGFIRKNTRDFCLKMLAQAKAGKRWTVKELDALDNGPKQPKPVSQCRGGWRCHHDTEPDPFYEGK